MRGEMSPEAAPEEKLVVMVTETGGQVGMMSLV